MMKKSNLKPGWKMVRFGDVVKLKTDRVVDPLAQGIERYVGLEHLTPEDLHIHAWGLVADGTTFTNYFKPGQVLFGKRRAYQRKVAVAEFEGVCSGDIYVFEPKDDQLLPELLPFICQSDAFFEHAVGTSAGSLSPRTNWEHLARFEFALAPVNEQNNILKALISSSQLLEALTDLNKQISSVYLSSIDHFVTALYERARSKRTLISLGECASVTDCKHRTPTFVDEGIPYVAPGNIDWGPLDFKGCKKLNTEEYSELMNHVVVKPGDIVLSRNQTYGIAAYVKNNSTFAFGQDTVLIQEGIYPTDFIYIMLRSSVVQQQIRQKSMGTTFKRINLGDIRKLQIPYGEEIDFKKASLIKNEFEEKKSLIAERQIKYKLFHNQVMAILFANSYSS